MTSTQSPVRANMNWVTDDLATGGDLHWHEDQAAQQIADWVSQGVTHVIDMRMEYTDEDLVATYAPHIKYLYNPSNDSWNYNMPQEVFDAGVEFARDAAVDGGKVLAHCHMGINRGPSMALAILLDRGLDVVEAHKLIRTARPIAGIAYAKDAYIAHLKRMAKVLNANPDPKGLKLREFNRYLKQVNTPNEFERINGIIRGLRAKEGGTVY